MAAPSPNKSLGQVTRHKCFSLSGHGTRDQNRLERLTSPELVKPGTQSTKLLSAVSTQGGIDKNVFLGVRMPIRRDATRSKIVELQGIARERRANPRVHI